MGLLPVVLSRDSKSDERWLPVRLLQHLVGDRDYSGSQRGFVGNQENAPVLGDVEDVALGQLDDLDVTEALGKPPSQTAVLLSSEQRDWQNKPQHPFGV